MRTVMTVFGTRPEIIRLSELFRELDSKGFRHIMVNTAQNFSDNLNSLFFRELGIRKPDYDFGIREAAFGKQVAQIIQKSEDVILKERPDVLLILGDTNSGLAAIPAAYHGVKVAHWESGMRSFNWDMPEEKNRRVIDHLSSIFFPYTEHSRRLLIREGIHPARIFVTGNPIVDVLEKWKKSIDKSSILGRLDLKEKQYMLCTVHRTENVDFPGRFREILKGLGMACRKFKMPVIYPMHPRAKSRLSAKIPEGVRVIEPLGFFDFTKLEKHAACLLTDSGTVQEEGAWFKIPCVSVRQATERPETVELGSNIVSGIDAENITACVNAALKTKPQWDYEFGDGRASVKVANALRGNLDIPIF